MAGHRPPGGEIGKRLLPTIIDEVARDEPNRAWASLPIDDYDLSQGFEDVTYAAFANGINKLAHCISAAFGSSKTFETVIYLGIPDIRYYMLMYAVCKTGHKVLLSSHMNSLSFHFSLMDQTDCKAMLVTRGVYVDDILAERPMPKVVIPELDDLLDLSHVAAPFPFTKTFAHAQADPFAVCHTTGTTGEPKLVTVTNGSMATMDIQTDMPDVDGRGHWSWQPGTGARYLMLTSPFHSISVVLAMTASVFGGGILIPGFRHRQVSDINETLDIIKHSGVTTGFMPSFLMDGIARRPDAEEYIRQFKTLSYGNGTLSEYAGQTWSKHIRFQCVWGSSETLTPPILVADPEDFTYVYFDVDAAGMVFREKDLEYLDEDGSKLPLYELVFTFNPKSERYSGYWAGLGITTAPSRPPYPEYLTEEVWTPHPDPKKARYAWRFISRIHDLNTHANEFSIAMEKALSNHEQVQHAIVLGKHLERPIALVELAYGVTYEMAAKFWKETIAPANELLPEPARIVESHLILVEYGGFERSPEGHLLKRQTEQKYSDRVDAIYGRSRRRSSQLERPRYESIIETVEIVVQDEPNGC